MQFLPGGQFSNFLWFSLSNLIMSKHKPVKYWAVVASKKGCLTPARSKCCSPTKPTLRQLRNWGAFTCFYRYHKSLRVQIFQIPAGLYDALSEFSWVRPHKRPSVRRTVERLPGRDVVYENEHANTVLGLMGHPAAE